MINTIARQWVAFFLLAFAWGSSYMWIKIALRELTSSEVVLLRVCLSTLGLLAMLTAYKRRIPKNPKVLAQLFTLSMLSIIIPFQLLSWGVSQISSALVGILNGTVPLFTVLFAHFVLPQERMNLLKFIGLTLGFIGSLTLVASSNLVTHGNPWLTFTQSSSLGSIAVLAASACYGLGAVYARKYLEAVEPLTKATTVTLLAAITLATEQLLRYALYQHSFTFPQNPLTWAALCWLGLIGSCLAYVLYFKLLSAWDASRVSVVMYVSPVVAVTLGLVFLGETANSTTILGSALIFSGVAVANIRTRS